MFKRIPNISYFKVFGCKCFILNTKDNLSKFDSKYDFGIFLGYSSTSKAYRVFNKRTLVVEETMHIEFDERDICSKDVSSDAGLVEDMKELTITPKEDDQVKETTPAPSEQELTPNQGLPKRRRFNADHPEDLILGDVS